MVAEEDEGGVVSSHRDTTDRIQSYNISPNNEVHGCQAYTVDRKPQKQISKIVSDLDLSNV